jgi:uncharacterized protein (DUF58 family)
MAPAPPWYPLGPLTAAATGVLLAAGAMVLARPDLAVLGAPLVITAVWSLHHRPAGRLGFGVAEPEEADGSGPAALVTLTADGAEAIRLRAASPGHRPVQLLLAPRHAAVTLSVNSVRTGPQPTFHLDADARAGAGCWAHEPVAFDCPDALTLPEAQPLGRVPAPRRLRGLTGPRTSRRPGDGLELRDVHALVPGESFRRVDWRTTARQPSLDTLWIRGSYANAEAVAALIVDSRDDVGPELSTWGGRTARRVDEATSLDLARHAAASVARAYLAGHDRVGLYDLASGRRPLAPATGHRQLRRIAYALALSAPIGSARRRVRAPQIPADAIAYVFTTLLDDESLDLVKALAETGHRVVVVDTLPDIRPVADPRQQLAWRITRLERDTRLARLGRDHIPVVRWAGPNRDHARAGFELMVRATAGQEARR